MPGILTEIVTTQQFHVSWQQVCCQKSFLREKKNAVAEKLLGQLRACTVPGSPRVILRAQNGPNTYEPIIYYGVNKYEAEQNPGTSEKASSDAFGDLSIKACSKNIPKKVLVLSEQ